MIGHDQPRALLLSLSDGSRISFESEHLEIDLMGAEEKLTKRYGASGVEVGRYAYTWMRGRASRCRHGFSRVPRHCFAGYQSAQLPNI